MNSVGPATPVPNPWVMGLLPAVMVTLAGLMPQLNGLPGEFVFDDTRVVEGVIERVRRGEAPEFGRRPVLDCSFWLTAVLVGPDAPGFRAINILIHTLAGLVLFAIVRSVARRQPQFADCPLTAEWLAAAVAALWLVHPLNTQAVTYIVQRGESLMGLCYLLTIYCVLQCAHSKAKGWAWAIGAVVACLLGMGIKPVMISAPIMAMLFDRAFIGGSFAQAVRRRWGLYLGLGATWLALGPLVMPDLLATEGSSAGFGMAMLGERQYLLSQGQVISHYLRLSFWPNPLVLDYLLDWIPAALLGWREWLPQLKPLALACALLPSAALSAVAAEIGQWEEHLARVGHAFFRPCTIVHAGGREHQLGQLAAQGLIGGHLREPEPIQQRPDVMA